MPYVQGSKLNEKYIGSLGHKIEIVNDAICKKLDSDDVNIVSVHENYAYGIDGAGKIFKASYKFKNGDIGDIEISDSDDIPVFEEDEIPNFVSVQLKDVVEKMMNGELPERTQVRELYQMISEEEDYWMSDVMEKIYESMDGSDWYKMYDANQDKIRTSLYGEIRKIESPIPKTRYTKINSSKLLSFDEELKESLTILKKVINEIVDECEIMVFDNDSDFYGANCESLKVEAQAITGLLSKAEKLMRQDEIVRIAEAHDKLAERAKEMAVVAKYLKNKSQQNKINEE